MYNYDTAGTKTGCMHRSLPGTVQDSNFSLGVVEVMYDCSRIKSIEASAVIASCLYTMYVYLCKIYQCNFRRCESEDIKLVLLNCCFIASGCVDVMC